MPCVKRIIFKPIPIWDMDSPYDNEDPRTKEEKEEHDRSEEDYLYSMLDQTSEDE